MEVVFQSPLIHQLYIVPLHLTSIAGEAFELPTAPFIVARSPLAGQNPQ